MIKVYDMTSGTIIDDANQDYSDKVLDCGMQPEIYDFADLKLQLVQVNEQQKPARTIPQSLTDADCESFINSHEKNKP